MAKWLAWCSLKTEIGTEKGHLETHRYMMMTFGRALFFSPCSAEGQALDKVQRRRS